MKRIILAVTLMAAGGVHAAGWVSSGNNVYVNDGGNVGINTTNPQTRLDVYPTGETGAASPRFFAYGSEVWRANYFQLIRGQGSKSAPSAVADGNTLGAFDFWGVNSSGDISRAVQIRAQVDGSPGSGYVPGALALLTTNESGTYAQRMVITANGEVGINTTNPTHQLSVDGGIRAREIVVDAAVWPDYVFNNDYELMPIDELKEFIATNGHLPGMVTESQVKSEGVSLGNATKVLLQKVEELTLYVIQLKEENAEIRARLEQDQEE